MLRGGKIILQARTHARDRVLGRVSGLFGCSYSSTTPTTLELKDRLVGLAAIEKKAVWLSSYMIHNANNIRPKRDGLKVGGHQASSTSLSTILTALYFSALKEKDRVSVKPHASPFFHALQYMMGNQTLDQLQRFRAFGGIQSYPSRTKDSVDIDFSTGSVGLGATITSFMAHVHDWLALKGPSFMPKNSSLSDPAKMIAIIGDAELDEGNIHEGLIESWKLDFKNNWFIVDYNRQSLDKVSDEGTWKQIDKAFRSNDWEVVNIKYGKKLQDAFTKDRAGKALKRFFNSVQNDTFSSLCFRGGAAFRKEITTFISGFGSSSPGGYPALAYDSLTIEDMQQLANWLNASTDSHIQEVMTNLGGHCLETLLEAFSRAQSTTKRTAFICYTIKGHMLPLSGHKENHGAIMNATQIGTLQHQFGVKAGEEWSTTAGLSPTEMTMVDKLVAACPFVKGQGKGFRDFEKQSEIFEIPESFLPEGKPIKSTPVSTQTAFGQILLTIGKSTHKFADRIMTMAPDVTTSTNLSGFVSMRGVFGQKSVVDSSKKLEVASAVRWDVGNKGQHVELGIAENNLMLALAAAGMSHNIFGQRVIPIGTLYDPFISRGLDALNYGCYQDSRFLLVATPSGITLSPEGGAHQSINTPLIGMSQPGLTYFEPATADELDVVMSWAFRFLQKPYPEGGSVYLRLSTRPLEQPLRAMTPELRESITKGAYWLTPPSKSTKCCIIFCGVVRPEAIEAQTRVVQEVTGGDLSSVALLQVTSADRLYKDFHLGQAAGKKSTTFVHELLRNMPSKVPFVTVLDGHPASLSWLGGVHGNRLRSLGVTSFGQSGDILDLYREHKIDAAAITEACVDVLSASAEVKAVKSPRAVKSSSSKKKE